MSKKSDGKVEVQQRIGKVRAYLAALGLPVSQTQAYEVAARVLGFENKHFLAAALPEISPAALCFAPKNAQPPAQDVKGFKLIRMDSAEGSTWHRYFLAPAHLDVTFIKQKLEAEALRLKEEEGDGTETGNYWRYQGLDVMDFARSLGLEPIEPVVCAETWDVPTACF